MFTNSIYTVSPLVTWNVISITFVIKRFCCLLLPIGMHDSQMACLHHNAAWYITRLLVTLALQGVTFSFLFFSCFSLRHNPCTAACRVRLVMLFSLRYEREGRAQTSDLLQRLQETGVARPQLALVRTLLLNCGQEKRVGDLFSDMTFSSRFATLAKQNLKVCSAMNACIRCVYMLSSV